MSPTGSRALLGIGRVALGCVFAAIGIYQAWTNTLIYAQDLRVANAYTTYFRVTSLFKDPSIYGRQLVVSATARRSRSCGLRKLRFVWAALLIAVLYVGLYFSYSQSSMAVLFAASLAVTIALADRPSRNVVVVAALVAALAAARRLRREREGQLVAQGDERPLAPDQRDRDGDRQPPLRRRRRRAPSRTRASRRRGRSWSRARTPRTRRR